MPKLAANFSLMFQEVPMMERFALAAASVLGALRFRIRIGTLVTTLVESTENTNLRRCSLTYPQRLAPSQGMRRILSQAFCEPLNTVRRPGASRFTASQGRPMMTGLKKYLLPICDKLQQRLVDWECGY